MPPPPPPSTSSQPTTPTSPGDEPTPAPGQLDETVIAALPDPDLRTPVVQTGRADDVDATPAMPLDQVEWAAPGGPQVLGDQVWVSPEDLPNGEPGEDGQYRLWE
jgi:hypothetical protein